MIILGGSASNGIDLSLSKLLNVKHEKLETTKFPDGEVKVRVNQDIKEDVAVIVQSTSAPQEKNLFELMFTAEALRENVREIVAVIPYLAYARQDKSFLPGEVISIHAVLRLLAHSGVTTLVTVNPHKEEPLKTFKGKVCTVNAIDTLAQKAKKSLSDPLVLAPDISGVPLAKKASEIMGCEYTYVEKKRESGTQVTITKTHGGDFKGKDVIIFDDMISTGGTIETATKFAYGEGAKTVSTAAVHLLMVNNAYERLKNAGITKIFGTNTIPYEKAELADVAPDIAECIKKMA